MKKIWEDPFYSRSTIESQYHKLTDRQWEILQIEVNDADEDENVDLLIHEVCLHIDSYEQEHDSWNARLAARKTQTEE
jgi:hypothetical protein